MPGRYAGISIGDQWYCSPHCFALGASATLSRLAVGNVVEIPRQPRLSLALALFSKGYVSEDQLRLATAQARTSGQSPESILMQQGWVNEKHVAAARGAQWGYPALVTEIPDHIVEVDLPPSLLRACAAAPVHFSAKTRRLVLGFVDRVDQALVKSIEQISGCMVEPCFITSTMFHQKTEGLQTPPGYKEVFADHPGPAERMGRTLLEYVAGISGAEARFTRCNARIWARITADHGTVDTVFSVSGAWEKTGEVFSTVVPKVLEALG
jgi:hypothetical protein